MKIQFSPEDVRENSSDRLQLADQHHRPQGVRPKEGQSGGVPPDAVDHSFFRGAAISAIIIAVFPPGSASTESEEKKMTSPHHSEHELPLLVPKGGA